MPRARKPENAGLPNRWLYSRNAIYYQVPAAERHLWNGKQQVKLGATLEEAHLTFSNTMRMRDFGLPNPMSQEDLPRVVRTSQWENLKDYAATCNIPLTFLRGMYAAARSGADSRGFPFELSPRDLIRLAVHAGGACMLTGIPWDYESKNVNGKRMWAPSLDRIDCSKGYVEANCRLVCTAVNIALSDFGEHVLLRIAAGLKSKKRI